MVHSDAEAGGELQSLTASHRPSLQHTQAKRGVVEIGDIARCRDVAWHRDPLHGHMCVQISRLCQGQPLAAARLQHAPRLWLRIRWQL